MDKSYDERRFRENIRDRAPRRREFCVFSRDRLAKFDDGAGGRRKNIISPVPGIPHGHTGHVRFLTCVETTSPAKPDPRPKVNRYSLKSGKGAAQPSNINRGKLLVISGGDGYEDFRGPQASAELQAGREDSTNHLLLWKV